MSKIKRALPEDIDITLPDAPRNFEELEIPDAKHCPKCGLVKPLVAFNRDKNRQDGRYLYCKDCRKPLLKTWANRTRKRRNEVSLAWDKTNRPKKNAHLAVNRALEHGLIEKQPCIYCGNAADVEAHHPDYSKKLEVVWLCTKHHANVHSGDLPLNQVLGLASHDCNHEAGSFEEGCECDGYPL